MTIVKFLDKTWQEIPNQDNPAMPYEGQIEECLMIFKGKCQGINDGGFVVARVSYETDITKLGVFWKVEVAERFAESINIDNDIDTEYTIAIKEVLCLAEQSVTECNALDSLVHLIAAVRVLALNCKRKITSDN